MSTHRVIEDRADVDALPYESVVRDYGTAVFEKWDPRMHGRTHWRQVGSDDGCSVAEIVMPVEVLYIPEEEA